MSWFPLSICRSVLLVIPVMVLSRPAMAEDKIVVSASVAMPSYHRSQLRRANSIMVSSGAKHSAIGTYVPGANKAKTAMPMNAAIAARPNHKVVIVDLSNCDDSSTAQNIDSVPNLQGVTIGTIPAQDADATVIQGINDTGAVRVNNLANLEALLNVLANCAEIGGVAFGLSLLVKALHHLREPTAKKYFLWGVCAILIGLPPRQERLIGWSHLLVMPTCLANSAMEAVSSRVPFVF